MSEKSIVYNPNWRIFRFQFIISLLLIPLLIGLPLLIFFYFKWRRIEYIISNDRIEIRHLETVFIPLDDISDIEFKLSDPFLRIRTGNIHLKTKKNTYILRSLTDGGVLFDALASQIEQLKHRKTAIKERDRLSVKADPGSLERLNDLLGLWQQGLISDEDYWMERKKFEK